MQLVEDAQHLVAARAVERTGRLVGKNDFGIVHKGARDGNALLLAAGKLARAMIEAVRHAKATEQPGGIAPAIAL
ncbi:hypothetical protein D3C71_1999010 [compost metagenome]